MNAPVLLCTVGGSHQPILSAIRSSAPRYVCFFATGKDPGSGNPGSMVQITGAGKVIKARLTDERPTLPNVPTQAGLAQDTFSAREVPADDLDGTYLVISDAIAELHRRFPDARFVADYTGGTKTMTAALVCAALDSEDVDLQLVTGARDNLVRVADGTERAMGASVARLRLDRTMARYLEAWRRFAYREAAHGLEAIRISADHADRSRLDLALALSRALASWDDFDHDCALALIEPYQTLVSQCHPTLLPEPDGQHRALYGEDHATLERINESAEIASRAFDQFRKQQTALGGEVTATDKANLRSRLDALESELNRFLAVEYRVKPQADAAYTAWRDSHRPFHWFVEFYGIMNNRGGSDVIIGNPPYVEYSSLVGT